MGKNMLMEENLTVETGKTVEGPGGLLSQVVKEFIRNKEKFKRQRKSL